MAVHRNGARVASATSSDTRCITPSKRQSIVVQRIYLFGWSHNLNALSVQFPEASVTAVSLLGCVGLSSSCLLARFEAAKLFRTVGSANFLAHEVCRIAACTISSSPLHELLAYSSARHVFCTAINTTSLLSLRAAVANFNARPSRATVAVTTASSDRIS